MSCDYDYTYCAIDDKNSGEENVKMLVNDDDRKLINVISQLIKQHATNYHENFTSLETAESSTCD